MLSAISSQLSDSSVAVYSENTQIGDTTDYIVEINGTVLSNNSAVEITFSEEISFEHFVSDTCEALMNGVIIEDV